MALLLLPTLLLLDASASRTYHWPESFLIPRSFELILPTVGSVSGSGSISVSESEAVSVCPRVFHRSLGIHLSILHSLQASITVVFSFLLRIHSH
ncbi:hypothetical protein [Phaffia rhodozyma]|uniref:Secreted protein n=1 Tax=Phaffia rhodozyma TaxID=264483 RepID=A0A0F7SVM1_PHARH|nr:hypothetical protein [Phaffia rhodozyma]